MKYLLESADLKIVDVQENDLEGGAVLIRAVCKASEDSSEAPKVESYLKNEEKFISPESLKNFSDDIQFYIKDFKDKIKSLKKDGQIVGGWGAGQRACTLLNLSGLTSTDIAYVIDVNKNYWWKNINGTGIQIVPPDYYKNHHADKIIIFSTGYADEIIRENPDFTANGGEFVKIT